MSSEVVTARPANGAATSAATGPEPGAGRPPLRSPLVTALISVRNGEDFIAEAIRSVLEQTYAGVELLVVDNASTDRTGEVVARFGSKVRYVKQDDRGTGGGRQTGLGHARGDLIALLDHDDLWLPHKLERLVPYFAADPEVGLVHSGARFFMHGTGETTSVVNVAPKADFYDMLSWCSVVAGTAVFRKDAAVEVGGFDQDLGGVDDWDMWIRIANRYKVRGHDEVLSEIRVHGNNQSHDPYPTLSRGLLTLEKNAHLRIDERARYSLAHARRRLRHSYYVKMCRRAGAAWRSGSPWQAVRLRLVAMWRNPRSLFRAPGRLARRLAEAENA